MISSKFCYTRCVNLVFLAVAPIVTAEDQSSGEQQNDGEPVSSADMQSATSPEDINEYDDGDSSFIDYYDLSNFRSWLHNKQIENAQPLVPYPTPFSDLLFHSEVDVQVQTIAVGEGDISIRGGSFAQTGKRLGAESLSDPFTQHYLGDAPVSRRMLTRPIVFTGIENALYGFNSTAGTLEYYWEPIRQNYGYVAGGGGNNGLWYASAYAAHKIPIENTDWQIGADFEFIGTDASGPRPYSGSELFRYDGRIQFIGPRSQTDIVGGFQSKEIGWQQTYINEDLIPPPLQPLIPQPFNSKENLHTTLFLVNHLTYLEEDDFIEIGGYWRRNNIFFDLEQTVDTGLLGYTTQNDTEVFGLGARGKFSLEYFDVRYSSDFAADKLTSTTLFPATGFAHTRTLYKFSVVPERVFALNDVWDVKVQAGGSFDNSNRFGSAGSPIGGVSFIQNLDDGDRIIYYAQYAKSTQVPGDLAIGSPNLLFLGNPDLGRVTSDNYEVGINIERSTWRLHSAVYYRDDNGLNDWLLLETNNPTIPFDRAATAVDVKTLGVEMVAFKKIGIADLVFAYNYLDRQEEYGTNQRVLASYYAGNYARNRINLGFVLNIFGKDLVIENRNELRFQAPNLLRTGTRNPVISSLGIFYSPPQIPLLEFTFSVENLFNQNYESIPGILSYGRQFRVGGVVKF